MIILMTNVFLILKKIKWKYLKTVLEWFKDNK